MTMERAKRGRGEGQFGVSTCLKQESPLREAVRLGTQAIAPKHRGFIRQDDRQRIRDSVDIDEAFRQQHPNEHRWDYLLSVASTRKLLAMEPHSPSDSEIAVVIAKRHNALKCLREHMHPGHLISHWLWVSDGNVRFSQMEKARRVLDQNGITWAGRRLKDLSTY